MLIDRAEITIRGGNGGAGVSKKPKGPDGGNGGNGGDTYVKASSNINLLNQFSEKDVFTAGSGAVGARNNKTGKDGHDLDILLPIGTSIYDKKTGELIYEISKIDERFLICRGGKGGYGGEVAQLGERGEEKKVNLSLRLIAEYGLIGLPNAGKSSLLNELTNAEAKTANYPFTTLEPNLGVLDSKCIADIPGLIEGASMGRGLGVAFLKHIEKVSILLHCISCETKDPTKDYEIIRKELSDFKKELLDKPEIIILTKSDTVDPTRLKELTDELKKIGKKVFAVSIHDFQSLEKLKKGIL
jgi:GTP-binding protein